MALDKAAELLQSQIDFGRGYKRNATKLTLADIQRDHSLAADKLFVEHRLEKQFGFKTGEIMTS